MASLLFPHVWNFFNSFLRLCYASLLLDRCLLSVHAPVSADSIIFRFPFRKLYWWGMKTDCAAFAAQCLACHRASRKGGLDAIFEPIRVYAKLEHWQLDLFGPLKDTPDAKGAELLVFTFVGLVACFVLVFRFSAIVVNYADYYVLPDTFFVFHMVDCYSKLNWAIVLDSKEAEPIAARLEDLFKDEGAPKKLQCDNGGEFARLPEVCDRWQVLLVHALPYNPKCNGQVRFSFGPACAIFYSPRRPPAVLTNAF